MNNIATKSFKEMIAAKTLVQLLDETRAIIRARPFWGFSDNDLDNVRIPINFKPKTETEVAIPVYYLHSKDDNCESYQWFANRRNLDGHLAAFEETENSIGRVYYCFDFEKDHDHLTISGPDYKSGIYFIGLDILSDTRDLQPSFYNAGVEVIDLVNFYPNIFSLVSDIRVPAFRFNDNQGRVMSMLYDRGPTPSVQIQTLPSVDCYMPIFRRLDADEY